MNEKSEQLIERAADSALPELSSTTLERGEQIKLRLDGLMMEFASPRLTIAEADARIHIIMDLIQAEPDLRSHP